MSEAAVSKPSDGPAQKAGPGAAAPEPRGGANSEGTNVAAPPQWGDTVLPWFGSFLAHVGLALLVLFAFYMARSTRGNDSDRTDVIIPIAQLSETPGMPGGTPNPGQGDPTRQALQDRIRAMNAAGWSQANDSNVQKFIKGGDASDSVADIIAVGSGATMGGTGKGGVGSAGALAGFGPAGGGEGLGPRSSFYGTGGNALKIVYVLDHSGSMLDNFDFLRSDLKKSVNKLLPVQSFAVIVFSKDTTVLGPKELLRVSADSRKTVFAKLDNVVAQDENDGLLDPFLHAFQQAFALKPQLIYFLTDGQFDPRLMDEVQKMNPGKKVHINTIAFISKDTDYISQLQKLAQQNGGGFSFVSENDLGR